MIGPELKRLRTEAGHTMKQFAIITGKTDGYISQVESGHKVPTPEFVADIALALKIEPDWLLRLAKAAHLEKAEREISARCAAAKELWQLRSASTGA